MQGFLTKDDTQLIFWDTPGLVTSKQAKRHKLPSSIFNDPRNAFLQCDVIALVVDCVDHKHTNKIPPVLKEGIVGGRSIETLTTQHNPGKGLITHDFSSHL